MQHGNGTQQFLRKSYLKKRQKALLDKSGYTSEELDRLHLDIKNGEGTGRTDYRTTEYWKVPYPQPGSGISRKKGNLRNLPWIGW